MTDLIVIAFVLVAVGYGIYSTVGHFKGKSACCGGGSYKPKKKRLKSVLYERSFVVNGMHCKNCKAIIEQRVNDIKGVSASVDYKKSLLLVKLSEEVNDGDIIARVQGLGYQIERLDKRI